MLQVSVALVATGALASAGVVATAAAASKRGPRHLTAQAASAAASKAPTGVVFGGFTPQNWPIVIELNKDRTKIVRIVTGLDMTCTSTNNFGTTDVFENLTIDKKSRFSATFGPERIDAGGTPAEIQGAMTGKRTKDKSAMKGTWTYSVKFYDAAGTNVVDACDSGLVSWKAKQ